jgi:hypothetical protein
MIYHLARNALRYTAYFGIGLSTTIILAGNLTKTAKSVDRIQQAKERKKCFEKCAKYDYADMLMEYNTCINKCEFDLL